MFRLVKEPSSGLFIQDKRYMKFVNIGIPLLITIGGNIVMSMTLF
jgi:hypothetical protein